MDDVTTGLATGQRFLSSARSRDLSRLTSDQVAAEVVAVAGVIHEAQALQLALLAEADRKNVATTAGEPSLTALVARQTGVDRGTAAKQVRLAQQIGSTTTPRTATRESLSRPGMSPMKATLITDALDALPSDLTREQVGQIEAELVAAAPDMSVEQFRRKAKRCLETIDLDRANDRENRDLERQEAAQAKLVEFWIGRPDDATGLVSFGGKTDPLTADMLRSALEAKTAPRKRRDPVGTRPDHQTVMREAFCSLVKDLPADGGYHGGVPATVVVTISEDSLLARTHEAGLTSHGTPISAAEARRLACGAGILPTILDSQSQVLDLGRKQRVFSPAQHHALAQRDHGCAHPGCNRPPGWTEAHHLDHWTRDHGPTDLANGVLLCGFHHRLVHTRDIPIRINPDTGTPEFKLHGHWTINHRYQPRRQRRQPALV